MEFFRENFFREVSSKTRIFDQHTFSNYTTRTPMYEKFDIFLSYNINDMDVVKGIYYYLKNKGLSVYLDCIDDPDMKRYETDKQTAERIHKRLMNSKSLLYAQSPNAGTSNWMPWELGVVDGHTHNCFILPVSKDATPISPKREYLSCYPLIKSDVFHDMHIITENEYRNEEARNYVNYINGLR